MITFWKWALLLQRNTAFEPTCDVARNSPLKAKSIDRGAYWNVSQSINEPVKMSKILRDLSRELHKSHLLSGLEKQRSVIRFSATFKNRLTVFRPFLAFSISTSRFDREIATRSLLSL